MPCKAPYTTIKLSSLNWNRSDKSRLNTTDLLIGKLTYRWCFKPRRRSTLNCWLNWHRTRRYWIGTLNNFASRCRRFIWWLTADLFFCSSWVSTFWSWIKRLIFNCTLLCLCDCYWNIINIVYGWFNCIRLYCFLISWDWLNSRWLDRSGSNWFHIPWYDWSWLDIIDSFWLYSHWLDMGRLFKQCRNFCVSFCIIISLLYCYWLDCFWFV